MNIFFTNSDPILAANEHNYVHCVKMISESNQLLSTAKRMIDGKYTAVKVPRGDKLVDKKVWLLPSDTVVDGVLLSTEIYLDTHHNHPSALWVRQSSDHYNWLVTCTQRLCEIYTLKSGKVHAGESILKLLKTPPCGLVSTGFRKPPVAAPDEFKLMSITKGVEVAYQQYLNEKYKEWLARDKPMKVEWVLEKPSWVNI